MVSPKALRCNENDRPGKNLGGQSLRCSKQRKGKSTGSTAAEWCFIDDVANEIVANRWQQMRNWCPIWTSKCGKADRAPDKKDTRKTAQTRMVEPFFTGRGRRTWTLGTRFWRPLLYQLSYKQDCLFSAYFRTFQERRLQLLQPLLQPLPPIIPFFQSTNLYLNYTTKGPKKQAIMRV